MEYVDFLERVIADGIAGAEESYAGDSKAKTLKREGSVKGFEECRGKTPPELLLLLGDARKRMQRAYQEQADDYWYWRCREAEVEWTCNVVSAAMEASHQRGIVPVTGRGLTRAALILNDELFVMDEENGGDRPF